MEKQHVGGLCSSLSVLTTPLRVQEGLAWQRPVAPAGARVVWVEAQFQGGASKNSPPVTLGQP